MKSHEVSKELALHEEVDGLVYIPTDFGPDQGPVGEYAHDHAPKELVEDQFPAAKFKETGIGTYVVTNWSEALADRGISKPVAWDADFQ